MSGTGAWNDPEALNQHMRENGYEPWKEGGMADEQDRKEREELPRFGERAEVAPERGEDGQSANEETRLGKLGTVVTGVVFLAILAPFIGILWFWAIGVMQELAR